MDDREKSVAALDRFKRVRDAALLGDHDELDQHLADLMQMIEHDPVISNAARSFPEVDFDAWWTAQEKQLGDRRAARVLKFPLDPREAAALKLRFVRDVHEGDTLFRRFMTAMDVHKSSDAIERFRSIILRPAMEALTEDLRDAARLASPGTRALHGVAPDLVPTADDLGIFLSHKTADKPLVRRYQKVLQQLGFQPWLDEAELAAGDVLHREIQSGMKRSCAAVFFITENFRDQQWLRREIDLAVTQQIARANRFRLITLCFGADAVVPEALGTFLYVNVENDLDGLHAILKALPLELGPPRWKPAVRH